MPAGFRDVADAEMQREGMSSVDESSGAQAQAATSASPVASITVRE